MKKNIDLKKEWEKTKRQLEKFSKEAVIIAKKGEEELIKFSKKGKLHLDSSAIALKIEQHYYTIGKEYVKSSKSGSSSAKLESYISEIKKLEKDREVLKRKMKRSSSTKKKTAKKKQA